MAKGTIYGSTGNEYIDSKIEWTAVSDTNNTSTVTATLYYRRNNSGYTTYGTGTFSITINGKTASCSNTMTIGTDWVLAITSTQTINHDNDGRKTITISATGSIPGTSLSSTSCSGSATLDHIEVVTILSNAYSATLGGRCKLVWTPHATNFYYRVKFSLGNWSYTTDKIYPNTTSTYTYTGYEFPIDLASYITNSSSATMTAILYSYIHESGDILIGSGSTKTFTVTVPENELTKPTVSMETSPSSNLTSPYNSLYIQGLSKVKATLVPNAKLGATVSASSITVDGKTYASPYESDILSQEGKISVKATVKDSRGYYGTYYKEIEVIPYSKPYIRAKSGESSVIAARCDASANLTDSGTYLKIKAKAVYSKVISNGVQNNYGFIKFRYRKEGGTYSAWQTILNCETDKSDEVITPPLLNGALDIESNYQVQIIATDDFCDSAPITIAISSDAVYMDRPAGGKSMGLGGYSSGDGNLDVYWNINAREDISLFDDKGDEIPLGTTMPIPRAQLASGYNPDSLPNGVHVVANNIALKSGDTVIMYNGVLIQMPGDVGGNVKIQLALPVDANRNPMYRICWYSNWSDWRSMKI